MKCKHCKKPIRWARIIALYTHDDNSGPYCYIDGILSHILAEPE